MMLLKKDVFKNTYSCIVKKLSSESQKGVNAAKQCSVENEKGTVAIDFVKG